MFDLLKDQAETLKEIRLRSEETAKKEEAKKEQSSSKTLFGVF